MKVFLTIVGIIIAWFIGFIITMFAILLIGRLQGDSPEELYNFSNDDYEFIVTLILIWPLVLFATMLYGMWLLSKKIMIAIIETIVAYKDTKELIDIKEDKNE